MLALLFEIPSLIISDLPTLKLCLNSILKLTVSLVKSLAPKNSIHALRNNYVDFCVFTLHYIILCYVIQFTV